MDDARKRLAGLNVQKGKDLGFLIHYVRLSNNRYFVYILEVTVLNINMLNNVVTELCLIG